MQIFFAPMEGITDGILRRAHQELFGGIDVYGLPFHKLTHTQSLLTREKRDIAPEENRGIRVLPQALTRDAEQLRLWLKYVRELGYDLADLNIGCPSPTVTRRGRGSGMLADPEYLRRFLDAVFADLPLRLSVKTRIGYESPEEWPELLRILADYPFAHVTVHVRTAAEQYTGGLHPEAFAPAAAMMPGRVIYNGDLRTAEDVLRLKERFPDLPGLMIGRGLLSDPSLARQLRGGPAASEEELESWYHALYRGWAERFSATLALGRLKKLMTWPCGENLRCKRLLRRAAGPEECIRAILEYAGDREDDLGNN